MGCWGRGDREVELGGALSFELWFLAGFFLFAIVATDQFEDSASSCVAEAWFCQPEDTGVAAISFGQAGSDVVEYDSDGFVIAEDTKKLSAGVYDGGHGVGPFPPIFAFPPIPPLFRISGCRCPELFGFGQLGQSAFGDGNAAFDSGTSFFGFLQGGNDSAFEPRRLHGRFAIRLEHSFIEVIFALGEEQSTSQIFHQGFAMRRTAAESSANSSMSHDRYYEFKERELEWGMNDSIDGGRV